MPNYAKIKEKFANIHTTNAAGGGGTFGFVLEKDGHDLGVYSGFPTTLGERHVVAMMGTGKDYEFSIAIPYNFLVHGVFGDVAAQWYPKVDDVIRGPDTDVVSKWRVIGVKQETTQVIIHLGRYLQ